MVKVVVLHAKLRKKNDSCIKKALNFYYKIIHAFCSGRFALKAAATHFEQLPQLETHPSRNGGEFLPLTRELEGVFLYHLSFII